MTIFQDLHGISLIGFRKKTTLICRYFEVLGIVFRFHMGTIASGSLVITIITILKIITEKLLTNLANRKEDSTNFIVTCIANGSLTCLEDILNVFSTKAYIITGIYYEDILILFCYCHEAGVR